MVRKTKAEALATRGHILDAAEQVFDRDGVSQSSLADIAKAAGVSRGAIYWHFKNKADVLTAMLERSCAPLQELAQAIENEDEEDPLSRFRELLVQVFVHTANDASHRRICSILFHKCEYLDKWDDLLQRQREGCRETNSKIERSLRNVVRRGQLPATLDTRLAAILVHSYLDGIIAHWLLLQDSYDLHAEADRWADSLLVMLRDNPALCHMPQLDTCPHRTQA